MEFDSHNTKSPSRITGTSALGFFASSSGSDSTCWKCRSSSAQVHNTLRTLIDDVLPRTLRVMRRLLLQPLYFLDLAIDDGDHHGRGLRAVLVHPGLDDRFADLGIAAGVDVWSTHVFHAAVAGGGRTAFTRQLLECRLVVDDPLAAAKGFGRCQRRQQQRRGSDCGPDIHGAMVAPAPHCP